MSSRSLVSWQNLEKTAAGLLYQPHDLLLQVSWGAVRAGVRSVGAAGQALAASLGVAAHPQANRLGAGAVEASGGLDADLLGRLHQPQPQIIGLVHLFDHLGIAQRWRHTTILAIARCLGILSPQR